MATLSMISHCFHNRSISYHNQEPSKSRITSPRTVISMCCHGHEPADTSPSSCPKRQKTEKKQESKNWSQLPWGASVVGKFGKELKDHLSPKRKGDWKDLTLMSLSFAIYVYISQRIVCAYFVWVYMAKQLW